VEKFDNEIALRTNLTMHKLKSILVSSPHSTSKARRNGKLIPDTDHQTPSFQGDLSALTIENLMQLMSHAGLSGELRLETPDNSACFIIRSGVLIFGYLQFKLPRLGERLVKAGHITIDNLRECLLFYHEKKSRLRLGEILVARGYITIELLEDVIKEQVKDCFFTVLSWKKGMFSFHVDENPPEEDILLAERIDHLIIEGIVAMDNRGNKGISPKSLTN